MQRRERLPRRRRQTTADELSSELTDGDTHTTNADVSSSSEGEPTEPLPLATRCPRCHGLRVDGTSLPSARVRPSASPRRRPSRSPPFAYETPSVAAVAERQLTDLRRLGRQYAGVSSRRAVERLLKTSEFVLYHMTRDGDKEPSRLPLMVAYKTSFNDFRHYALRSLHSADNGQLYFFIETGPQTPPCFSSLASLVSYYEVYNFLCPSVEAFPWWRMTKDEHHSP